QGCALAQGGLAVVGVEFHHIAEGVHLVAVVVLRRRTAGAVVPAHILVLWPGTFPAVTTGSAGLAAIAVQRLYLFVLLAGRIILCIAEEIAEPVFFARDKRAPGGLAGAAVVQRAAGPGAGSVVPG